MTVTQAQQQENSTMPEWALQEDNGGILAYSDAIEAFQLAISLERFFVFAQFCVASLQLARAVMSMVSRHVHSRILVEDALHTLAQSSHENAHTFEHTRMKTTGTSQRSVPCKGATSGSLAIRHKSHISHKSHMGPAEFLKADD
eukprot:1187812-Prorocentrum_minimum.AAC.2